MSQNSFSPSARLKNNGWTAIPNQLIRSNMGNAAFRLLCYLGSNREGWEVYQAIIMKDLHWGREMLRGSIKELVEKKYLKVTQYRNESGCFSHNKYEFDFEPIEDSNNVTVDGFPAGGKIDSSEPPPTKTNLTNTNKKEEREESLKSNKDSRATPPAINLEGISPFSFSSKEEEKAVKYLVDRGYSRKHVKNVFSFAFKEDFWRDKIKNNADFIRYFDSMMKQAPKLEEEMSEDEKIEHLVKTIKCTDKRFNGCLTLNKAQRTISEHTKNLSWSFDLGIKSIKLRIRSCYGMDFHDLAQIF